MVGNHFDSMGHSFCDDSKSSFVKTSLRGKVSMQACVFQCSVGGMVWPVVLQIHWIRMKKFRNVKEMSESSHILWERVYMSSLQWRRNGIREGVADPLWDCLLLSTRTAVWKTPLCTLHGWKPACITVSKILYLPHYISWFWGVNIHLIF